MVKILHSIIAARTKYYLKYSFLNSWNKRKQLSKKLQGYSLSAYHSMEILLPMFIPIMLYAFI